MIFMRRFTITFKRVEEHTSNLQQTNHTELQILALENSFHAAAERYFSYSHLQNSWKM